MSETLPLQQLRDLRCVALKYKCCLQSPSFEGLRCAEQVNRVAFKYITQDQQQFFSLLTLGTRP